MRRLHLIFAIVVVTSFVSAFLVERSRPTELRQEDFSVASTFQIESLGVARGENTVRGRVFDHLGEPAAEVAVHLRPIDEDTGVFEPMFFDHTSVEGQFELNHVPEGAFELVLLMTGVPNTVDTLTVPVTGDLRLALAEPLPDLPLAPDVVRGVLRGMIVPPATLQAGADLSGYEVFINPRDDEEMWRGAIQRRVTTGPEGTFHLTDLAVADYNLRVLPPWARGGSWPYLAELPIHANQIGGEPAALRVYLKVGELTGVLVDTKNRPIEGALLSLRPVDEERRHHLWPPVSSDVEGQFSIRDLPPHLYELSVTAGGASEIRQVEVRRGQRTEARFGSINPRPTD